jgi:hypothetical protein
VPWTRQARLVASSCVGTIAGIPAILDAWSRRVVGFSDGPADGCAARAGQTSAMIESEPPPGGVQQARLQVTICRRPYRKARVQAHRLVGWVVREDTLLDGAASRNSFDCRSRSVCPIEAGSRPSHVAGLAM